MNAEPEVTVLVAPFDGWCTSLDEAPDPVFATRMLGDGFAIDPTGSYLLAANQRSDSIVVFAIDRSSGKLSPTGHTATVPSPVCLLMIPDLTK